MEVITIESEVFKSLISKVDTIFNYVISQQNTPDEKEVWADSHEVCSYLKISSLTLQRLRSEKKINYTPIRGKNYYTIEEIKRMMQQNQIRRSEECLQNQIQNHQKNAKQRQAS